MTPSQSRRFYNRLHADVPRHVDLTAVGLFIATVALLTFGAGMVIGAIIRALLALFGGLVP